MKKLTRLIVSLIVLLSLTFSLTACDSKTTVLFDAQGGIVSYITMKIKTNDSYKLPIPVKDGYTFICWLDGETEIANEGVWTSTSKNITLTAKYKVKDYLITFDANGGEVEKTSMSIDYNESVTLPTPTKKGYTFKGWIYNGKIVKDGAWKITSENIVLVAEWEIIDYIVTFDLNGGHFTGSFTNMEKYVVHYGKDYDFEQFNPVKGDGVYAFSFIGWEMEDGTIVDKIGTWKFDKNVTLIAIWENPFGPGVLNPNP